MPINLVVKEASPKTKKRFTRETDIGLEQSEIERICKDEFDMNMSDFKKIIYIKDKIINFVG